jgi:catechol 2,3-dioxygenase-like lactoylglutathione lyase family enzyme
MITGIDHLVIAVPDLDAAIRSYRGLGFTVVPGGRHPVGTHNALIAFADDSYVELIAFYENNPEHRWWAPLQKGGGLVDFCLQTDDLIADTQRLRQAGVRIDDPKGQSRMRPDGYLLRWVFALSVGAHRGVAPFLIRDETPRKERVPSEVTHPNGVTGVSSVTIAVDDVPVVRGWYEKALGTPAQEIERDDVDGMGVRVVVGAHALDFLAPRRPHGALREWLGARGPSPYAAALRSAAGPARTLDSAETLGARLSLVGSGL